MESENFLKTGGKSETGGKCIMASEGMDAPDEVLINITSPQSLFCRPNSYIVVLYLFAGIYPICSRK